MNSIKRELQVGDVVYTPISWVLILSDENDITPDYQYGVFRVVEKTPDYVHFENEVGRFFLTSPVYESNHQFITLSRFHVDEKDLLVAIITDATGEYYTNLFLSKKYNLI